jgi:L-histidine Nalpha-methyltransferase
MPITERAAALLADIRAGFSVQPKSLPPKWFYDEKGSILFDQITQLSEYYPTRVERGILAERAGEIAELTQPQTLIELGSGTSEKTRLLLSALVATGTLSQFTPFDVDPWVLRAASQAIGREYPQLSVLAQVGDFTTDLPKLAAQLGPGPALIIFLGSTIGNFEPAARGQFLYALGQVLRPGDYLLLGTDLVKDPSRLVAAYSDATGVTAAFNLNLLTVINRELGANFYLDNFQHEAYWNPQQEWIEMRLRTMRAHQVSVADLTIDFTANEYIRTEVSAKFRPGGLATELGLAGFSQDYWWQDPAGDFGLSLARRN